MADDVLGALVQPVSALEAVRRATAGSHRRLEAMPVQARLLHDDYALAEYRWMLTRLYGFYRPLALALEKTKYGSRWSERVSARADLLGQDLFALGLTPAQLTTIARCERLPGLDSSDRALGCAYVLEGSSLGGRVIFKHLVRTFRAHRGVSLRFFEGDGERTGARWREFCAALNADSVNVLDLCAAACATFDALSAWLDQPPAYLPV